VGGDCYYPLRENYRETIGRNPSEGSVSKATNFERGSTIEPGDRTRRQEFSSEKCSKGGMGVILQRRPKKVWYNPLQLRASGQIGWGRKRGSEKGGLGQGTLSEETERE